LEAATLKKLQEKIYALNNQKRKEIEDKLILQAIQKKLEEQEEYERQQKIAQ
jgi:hypothetical protein